MDAYEAVVTRDQKDDEVCSSSSSLFAHKTPLKHSLLLGYGQMNLAC